MATTPAGTVALAADLEFESGDEGPWGTARGQGVLVGLPMWLEGDGAPGTTWEFSAEQALVIEKSWKREGTVVGEKDFDYQETSTTLNASWASVAEVRARSFLTVVPAEDPGVGGSYDLEIPRLDVPLTSQAGSRFSTKYIDAIGSTVPSPYPSDESASSMEHFIAPPTIIADFGTAGVHEPFRLRGDIIVTMYDMSLTIHEGDGSSHDFESGHFYRNATAVPPGPFFQQGLYNEEEHRKIQLVLTNATVSLTPGVRPLQVNVVSADTWFGGDLRLRGVKGDMTLGDQILDIDASSFLVEQADLDIRLRPADSVPGRSDGPGDPVSRVSAHLQGTTGVVIIDGQPVALDAQGAGTIDAKPWLSPILWVMVPVTAAAAAFAWLVRARRRSLDPDAFRAEAEVALLKGDFRRTLSRADRAWRIDPQDVEAASLGAIALLRLGRPEAALDRLQKARARLGDQEDAEGVLRLMTIVSLLESGEPEAAESEIREAMAVAPGVVSDLLQSDLIADAAFRRTIERLLAQGPTAAPDNAYG